jgi:hypothetical protein
MYNVGLRDLNFYVDVDEILKHLVQLLSIHLVDEYYPSWICIVCGICRLGVRY